MPMSDILTADRYTSNAELIEAARDLGYLNDDMDILDPTFGLGVFWRNWRPAHLTATDLDPAKNRWGSDPVDFTAMPWPPGFFDAVVFDPPYKLNGTPTEDVDSRYGVHTPTRWQDRMQLCIDGIYECARVLKPRGYLLIKCMDQVVSGHKVWQTRVFADEAEGQGCELIDQLHMLTTPRPQPAGRRQVHSRANYSTLLITRKRP